MTGEGHLIFSVACVIFAKKVGLTPELAHGDWWHIIWRPANFPAARH